jgi:hypothetical protein
VDTSSASTDSSPAASQRDKFLHDDLQTEYYKIADTVASFDQRLLTIKGWGVTFSLAAIGLGFQQKHYGLFLVAAVSAIAFWLIEASTKLHQMRYYPRMGDIEVASYDLYRTDTDHGPISAPLIDWSWYTAWPRLRGSGRRPWYRPWPLSWKKHDEKNPHVPGRWEDINHKPGKSPMLFPHVAMPHLITVLLGIILFCLGLAGVFGRI